MRYYRMARKLARWIKGLTDEEKDRVIRAPGMRRYGSGEDDDVADRCLVQHVKDTRWCMDGYSVADRLVAGHFDMLCVHYGEPRVVAFCKRVAGRGFRPVVAEETVLSGVVS